MFITNAPEDNDKSLPLLTLYIYMTAFTVHPNFNPKFETCIANSKPPAPNGSRYPLVGGTRERHFIGTNSMPRKMPENAQTPTSQVHAVLGAG
jgi:hypothetical protein